MPRHFLIDGYNLAHAWSQVRQKLGTSQEAARETLLDLLVRYKKVSGATITVVFDGRSPKVYAAMERRCGIEMIFSSQTDSADQEIYSRISSSKDRGSLTVVSSDRQVIGFARRHGAQTMGSDEFSLLVERSLENRKDGDEKPQQVDVAEWLKIFGRCDG